MAEVPESTVHPVRAARAKSNRELAIPAEPAAPSIERLIRPRPQPLTGERASFPIRNIYLDDLQAIYLVLTRYTPSINFYSDEYRFKLPVDIKDIPQHRIKYIQIAADGPKVVIEGRNGSFTLSTFADDDESKAVYWELWPILNRNVSKIVKVQDSGSFPFTVMLPIVVIGFGSLVVLTESDRTIVGAVLTALSAIAFLALPLSYIVWRYQPDVVVRHNRREAPRPLYRTKEFALVVVTVILTALASLGVWALTER